MDVDAACKNIRSLYITLFGRNDMDIILTYKGTNYGVTKPFQVRIDAREFAHETLEGALAGLLLLLTNELSEKVKSTEGEANRLRLALNQLRN